MQARKRVAETERQSIADADTVQVNMPRWYTINRKLLPAKIASFCDVARYGSINEYLIIFYVSIGLNPAQSGLVRGIPLVGGLIGGPLWGYIADKTLRYQLITKIMCGIYIIAICFLPTFAPLVGDPVGNTCRLNKTHSNFSSDIPPLTGNGFDRSILMTGIIGISTISDFASGSINVFTTSGIISATRAHGGKNDFGKQKFVEPFGFAFGGFISGIVIDHFPKSNISCYMGMFIISAIFAVALGVAFHFLFDDRVQNSNASRSSDVNELSFQTLRRFETWWFFSIVLIHGILSTFFMRFSFFMLREMHASHSLMGLSMLIRGLSSAITLYISQYILSLCHGAIGAMALSFCACLVRYVCMYYLTNPLFALGIDVISGLTVSLFQVSYMEYINIKYPKEIHTFICGIVVVLFEFGGNLISLIVGGKLYMIYGGKHLFLYSGIVCSVLTIIMLIYALIEKRRNGSVQDTNQVNM